MLHTRGEVACLQITSNANLINKRFQIGFKNNKDLNVRKLFVNSSSIGQGIFRNNVFQSFFSQIYKSLQIRSIPSWVSKGMAMCL